ncbi:MAG: hypothetical protein FWF56_06420 [Firmicutes bacterium]|nr:hypothetical protein [Bacillota bacterium]MCL1953244.1 hypothetical protein [Bacillota bacterium]
MRKQSYSRKGLSKLTMTIVLALVLVMLLTTMLTANWSVETNEMVSFDNQVQLSTIKENFLDNRERSVLERDSTSIDTNSIQALLLKENFDFNAITAIKELSDFNGYNYFVIEFGNDGYLICDNEFLYMIEATHDGMSPYLGKTGNLLYLGPTHYYEMNMQQGEFLFKHTVLDEKIQTQDIGWLKQASATISQQAIYTQEVEREIGRQGMVRGGEELARLRYQSRISGDNANYNYNNGKNGGNCAYVAASIICDYWADTKGYSNLMLEDWAGYGEKNYDKEKGIKVVETIQGWLPGPSIGIDVKEAMNTWSKYRGYSLSAFMWVKPPETSVFDILSKDRPVIMGGWLANPRPDPTENGKDGMILHAVTVHGMRRWNNTIFGIHISYTDNVYEVNFGWYPDTNKVDIRAGFLNLGTENAFVVGF